MSAFDAVKQKLLARFGSVEEQQAAKVSVKWTSGGDAELHVSLTKRGNVKVEFTENLVEGITEPDDDENKITIRLDSGARIKVWNKTPLMHFVWNASTEGHTTKLLMDTIDTLIAEPE